MEDDKTPKVFISYSWSSDELVLDLAKRLVAHGVDVVLDKWDLKEGNDKYEFMERCVNDSEITKVLIICDKIYAQKANDRTGGVGDETVIISSEIYGNARQEKFIPIIAERDEEGKQGSEVSEEDKRTRRTLEDEMTFFVCVNLYIDILSKRY